MTNSDKLESSSDPLHRVDDPDLDWNTNPKNPWNWPTWKKGLQMLMLSSSALLASIGTSIISPARSQLMEEFGVSSTVALLPLALYVLALGFGPVIGSPLSETWGRYPVYLGTLPLGAVFATGAGFTHNFAALCFLRFMSGFCWAPVMSTAGGSLSDTFPPHTRGPASATFILMPFLGPGLGPVLGSYIVAEKGWRWTQWTLVFFAILCIVFTLLSEETFPPVIKRRLAKVHPITKTTSIVSSTALKDLLRTGFFRPIHMLFTEPIVLFSALYVSAEFGTLFSFFAGVPFTFGRVYQFSQEQSGLVFLAIVIGCVLGLITIMFCDIFLYKTRARRYPMNMIPPEYRLFPAMLGSIGLPVSLFWFGWTAREEVSWASPAASMILFAWGNICVFVSVIQFISDTYHGNVVASALSANSLARYGFAAAFPLFTIQMYETLGIAWATSLLGFIALALMPVPWVLFEYGKQIRSKSKYETFKDA